MLIEITVYRTYEFITYTFVKLLGEVFRTLASTPEPPDLIEISTSLPPAIE